MYQVKDYSIGGVLIHHGILNQKWGVRNGPPYPLDSSVSTGSRLKENSKPKQKSFSSGSQMSNYMKKNFKYKNFTTLKSHDQMAKEKAGDCHSQVMYEMEELRRMGKNPKAKFLIQVDPKTGQGGQTHSFVYYNEDGKIVWFENAWGGNEGVHSYSSYKDLKKDIELMFKSKDYPEIVWGNFNDKEHKSGESLQDLVNICIKQNESKTKNERKELENQRKKLMSDYKKTLKDDPIAADKIYDIIDNIDSYLYDMDQKK